jgi:hypothetical protein
MLGLKGLGWAVDGLKSERRVLGCKGGFAWRIIQVWRVELAVIAAIILFLARGLTLLAGGAFVVYMTRIVYNEVEYGMTPSGGGVQSITVVENFEDDSDDELFTASGRHKLFGRHSKVAACRMCGHSRCVCGSSDTSQTVVN